MKGTPVRKLLGLIGLKQNNVDPSPEARAAVQTAVDFVFKFAEYALIAGVFAFLANTTKSWAVIVIAVILNGLLMVHLLSLASGFQILLWREAKSRLGKFVLCAIDSILFLLMWYTLYRAFIAVSETMRMGIGI